LLTLLGVECTAWLLLELNHWLLRVETCCPTNRVLSLRSTLRVKCLLLSLRLVSSGDSRARRRHTIRFSIFINLRFTIESVHLLIQFFTPLKEVLTIVLVGTQTRLEALTILIARACTLLVRTNVEVQQIVLEISGERF
jgi:hypothetical protein